MGLPVSADVPMVAFAQYDLMNPPHVPPIRVGQDMQYIVPAVAASVANEASAKAHSHAGRMFFYNLAVNNFWRNPYFQEVVQMVTDLLTLNLRKNFIRSPEQGLQDATMQTITAQVSGLFYQYPELKSMVTPQVLDAAMQNLPFLNNLIQEISSMHNQNPGYGNYPVNTGYPGVHMGGYAHPSMGHPGNGNPGMHMVPHGGGHFSGHPQPYGNHQMHTGGGGGGRFDGPSRSSGSAFANPGSNGSYREVAPDSVNSDRFSGRQVRPQQQHVPVQQHVQQHVQQSTQQKKEVQTTLVIEKGSEMDRRQHQIAYFGESYVPDSAARGAQFAEATNALVEARIVEDGDSVFVDQNMTIEACLDSAITTGSIKQFTRQRENSSINVFRCFSAVTHPTFCVEDVSAYQQTLREADSFASLVVKLKTLAMSLSIMKKDKKYTDSVISFLNRFDNLLTRVINDFLRNNLQTGIIIGSFAEDATSLGDYLFSHKNYGPAYGKAFTQFESEILDTVLENVDPDLAQELMEQFNLPAGMYYGLMPVNHSLTFVPMNDRELGYKLGDKPVIIDPETAPSLYQIASSLVAHKKQMGINTLYDMLITADGVRYKLYRNYLKGGEYLIDRG